MACEATKCHIYNGLMHVLNLLQLMNRDGKPCTHEIDWLCQHKEILMTIKEMIKLF